MAENEGAVYAVFRTKYWPPPRNGTRLFSIPTVDEGSVEVTGFIDGRLRAIVSAQDGSLITQGEYQPISVQGAGRFEIAIMWLEGICACFINGERLLDFESGQRPKVIEAAEPPPSPPSIEHPDAAAICGTWVENRRAKFSQQAPDPGRRLKSQQEELADLQGALQALRDAKRQFQVRREVPIGTVAAHLRGLLHWQNDRARDRSYNPLLLRLASRANLPLPVYVGPYMRPACEFKVAFSSSYPSVVPRSVPAEVIDLQEAMLRPAVFFCEVPGTIARTLTLKDLVLDTAVILGAAHYDEDISAELDFMRASLSGDVDQLGKMLLGLAETVVDVGEWVIERLNAAAP